MPSDQPYPVRFLLFAGDDYYPTGGCGDFVGAADTQEGAQAMLPVHSRPSGRWATICRFDGVRMEEVAEFRQGFEAADKGRGERVPKWELTK